jgi:O-methyltransferase involved in polyketide biosynthesis
MRRCAAAAPGSLLLFTYAHSDVLTRPESFAGADRMGATLGRVGERLTIGLGPAAMGTYLSDRDFDRRWDLGAADYRVRYFGARTHTRVGHEFYRVALAQVRLRARPCGQPFSGMNRNLANPLFA